MRVSEFRRPDSGFTLLEVLVSLALLGIALVVIFQLFSAGLKTITATDDYAAAVIKSEAVMRDILDNDKLEARSWSELTTDGYRVDAVVSKALADRTEDLQVELLDIRVTLHWTKGTKDRAITLKTMKLVNKKI